ncbi:MAG: methyltransferase domain-containing protein [Desulfobacterales bacterium]
MPWRVMKGKNDPNQKKTVDVLWFVEHTAREMDVACAVKSLAVYKYCLEIEIRNYYAHAIESMARLNPRVVVHPFFYFSAGALATEDYVKIWPSSVHFNLAWEQIHYSAQWKIKAPSDDFAKRSVIHHAWGDFYLNYLMAHGVPRCNIFVNGHPAYQLYKLPYRNYFKTRWALANLYGLNPQWKWIFLPENYRWAFIGDKIKLFHELGADPKEIYELRDFCIKSLETVLRWCNRAGSENGLCVIFRPRPAVNSKLMHKFFCEHIGTRSPNLHFIKEESVRDWILASDLVVSSYSTSLIEAAVAGKPAYMLEPFSFPDSIQCEWYRHVPRILQENDFIDLCKDCNPKNVSQSLRDWAEREMLSNGDPIENLVTRMNEIVNDHKREMTEFNTSHIYQLNSEKKYFNFQTHENDLFSEEDIRIRVEIWNNTLNMGVAKKNDDRSAKMNDGAVIINKTMSRSDLLTKDAESTVKSLNLLINTLFRKGLWMSSWVGTLPEESIEKPSLLKMLKRNYGRFINRKITVRTNEHEAKALARGIEQRLNYQALPDCADDVRFPWFLYWEIYWVLKITSPYLNPSARLFDGGGSASLFTCYLASLGYEVHSVELNRKLSRQCQKIAISMGWNLHSYIMDMRKLDFPDEYFDHAFSICVFEHLDYDIKQAALSEIARCLKPGGIFAITFDYRNPAPGVVGYGKDTRPRNQLKSEQDIERTFLQSGHFDLMGNQGFYDNQESYLIHHRFGNTPYTFGAIFLRKKNSDH